jgi:hypothetical protein
MMHPSKVVREKMCKLTDLPNIAKAGAADLVLLGINNQATSRGTILMRCMTGSVLSIAKSTAKRHAPCVIDVFISVTSFINGGEPMPWWNFTAERKRVQCSKQG